MLAITIFFSPSLRYLFYKSRLKPVVDEQSRIKRHRLKNDTLKNYSNNLISINHCFVNVAVFPKSEAVQLDALLNVNVTVAVPPAIRVTRK